MENVNWLALIIGIVVCILALINVIPMAVGAGGLAILVYGIFSSK